MKHFFQLLKDVAYVVACFFVGLLAFILWFVCYPVWFLYQLGKEAYLERKARKDAEQ